MRIFSQQNVFDAALDRIRYLFDEFPTVVAGVSGGKDSTVIYHLMLEVARQKQRLPLPVFFLDQEAEYTSTIDWVKAVMYSPEVKPLWFQMPIYIENAASFDVKYLKCWDPEAEDEWLRPKDPVSIKENTFRTQWFLFLFREIFAQLYPQQPVAIISGVRCEESRGRLMGLTAAGRARGVYKWVTWAKKLSPGQFTFYPLYDWSYTDIWHAIAVNRWPYNRVYDQQYQYGLPIKEMRVSNLHHETSIRCVMQLQEFDKPLYDKLVRRLPGIATANMLQEEFFRRPLPYMFRDWADYRDHLIEKLTANDPDWQQKLRHKAADWDALFAAEPLHKEKSARVICSAVLTNDYNGTKISNFETEFVNLYKQERTLAMPWRKDQVHRSADPHIFALIEKKVRAHGGQFRLKQYRIRVDGDLARREEIRD